MTRVSGYEQFTAAGGTFPVAPDEAGRARFARGPRSLPEAWRATERFGPRLALSFRDERWTYAQAHAAVQRLASHLVIRFGVRQGDRVAIAMRNYPEWILSFWAVQVLGAVVVPLNAWLTAPELTRVLGLARPRLVIVDGERLERLQDRGWCGSAILTVRAGTTEFTDIGELLGSEPDRPLTITAEPAAGDIATVMFTSGTTGAPKPVAHTHLNHVSTLLSMRLRAAAGVAQRGGTPDVRGCADGAWATVLLAFPLFHVAGLTLLTSNMYAGGHVAVMYKWDAEHALGIIERERVTELSGPPMVIQQLVNAAAGKRRDLSSLRSLGIGGSAASPAEVTRIWETFRGSVTPGTGYGLTETTSAVTALAGEDLLMRPGSVGQALPTVELRTVDAAGRPLPPGEPGEIEVRGPQVAVSGAAALEPALQPQGDWFATGDIGRIDEDGYLYLVGRIKDVIIRAGENVIAAEVEAVIAEHPAVAEVAVVARRHQDLGEEVVAAVRLHERGAADAAALTAHAAASLAAFKIPAEIVIVGLPLPRSAAGKLDKPAVQRLLGVSRSPQEAS